MSTTKEPVVKAIRQARIEEERKRKASQLYRLNQLLEEQTRWERKQTIARNKLIVVRGKLDRLALEWGGVLDGAPKNEQ